MRLLIVTAVDTEAHAIGLLPETTVIVSGVGRTNAACATTQALLRREPFDAVISAGVAGALPGAEIAVGDAIVASSCVYDEEGLITSHGFVELASIGFALGDFEGNAVPVDGRLLELLGRRFRIGPIATVASCSGTDEAAAAVAARTGAIAEAMEGAAVVHAARRLGAPAIELRTISNRTGDRARQEWDLTRGLGALETAVREAVEMIRGEKAETRKGTS
jgi:futalosine hydrolase